MRTNYDLQKSTYNPRYKENDNLTYIHITKSSLLSAGTSKAASRGRQDRGRSPLMRPAGGKGWVKNKGEFLGRRPTWGDVEDNETSAHDQVTVNGQLTDATYYIAIGWFPIPYINFCNFMICPNKPEENWYMYWPVERSWLKSFYVIWLVHGVLVLFPTLYVSFLLL